MVVAVLLGFGVLLGSGALAVDVGRLHAEREQLQSGADAAALAVARNCVTAPSSCESQDSVADTFASDNANDGASAATVCGTLTGLSACGAAADNLTACIGSPPTSPYAEVRTSTELADGATVLPPAFAAALASGSDGSTVGACARATYGSPTTGTGLAVTFSTCEWNSFTSGGSTYWPAPPSYPSATSGAEKIIYLHGQSKASTCAAGNSGWDKPGGFGYLEADDDCQATVTLGFVRTDTGSSASGDCQDALHEAWAGRQPIYIPVYDGVTGTGSGIEYHVAGFAAFVVTGYKVGGSEQEKSWLSHPAKVPCSGSDRCISGYFVSGLLPSGSGTGGGNYGTKVVNLVG
jgi:Flp pilus assembly protein TadG